MSEAALRELIAELDRRILADPGNTPERFAKLTAAQRDAGLLHGDRPLCPFLRPLFLSSGTYRAIASAAEVVASAMERLSLHAFRDAAILDELDLTPAELDLARIDPGIPRAGLTTRLDTYLTDGGFGFLEYNGESPAGIGDQRQLETMLFDLPEVRAFLERHPPKALDPRARLLEALVSGYRSWGGQTESPTIVILDWSGVPTQSEFRVLRDDFEARGYPTLIADPGALKYDGATLCVDGRPVDILYKRVLIHELLARTSPDHPLTQAYRDGRIFMANAFRCKVAHKKASFAVLTDPQFAHVFTDEELDVARRHVPWTRRVREGDVEVDGERVPMRTYLLEQRDALVLKPNDDYGGHGVTVGYATDGDTWTRAVETAFAGSWVVQRRLPARAESVPHFDDAGRVTSSTLTVDFNPFVFDGRVEGGMVRLSGTALSNVSAGGGETAVAVIDVDRADGGADFLRNGAE